MKERSDHYPARWLGALLALVICGQVLAKDFQIGVYYFPGWKSGQKGNGYARPWDEIRPFMEREPLLGWYAEDDPNVMTQQLSWMNQYGIDYVVYDWLWGRDGKPYLTHGVDAYLRAKDKHGVGFSILWSNHTDYTFSKSQLSELFNFWVQRYFTKPEYLKLAGKPVVFIFSADVLNKNAQSLGMSSAELISMADAVARKAGLPGVAFVGGIGGNHGQGFDYSAKSGYAAWSAYNFHGPATKGYDDKGRRMSHSYAELDQGYRDHWSWMLDKADNTYILPMSSGWDKRPWGGSKDPEHDNSRATPAEFEAHLFAARKAMTEKPRSNKMGVICCWNEFGEGSYIEPTKKDGFKFLERVKTVFGGS